MPPAGDPSDRVFEYVRSLRRRALAVLGLRAALCAVGAGLVLLVFAAALAGPVVTPGAARLALGGLSLAAVGVLAYGLWPLTALSGSRASELLLEGNAALASRLRSALELRHERDAEGGAASKALIQAHAAAVQDALAHVPPADVVSWARLRHPAVYLGLGAVVWSALLLGTSPDLRTGARALLHPARMEQDGLRVAHVVSRVVARLIYPSYLGRDPETRTNPGVLEVPRGTTVELTVTPRVDARQGVLKVGDAAVRMDSTPSGQFFARFVAREDVKLQLRLRTRGDWYADDSPRSLRALPDKAPEVRILTPEDGALIKLHDVVELRFDARDDHGLTSLDLLVRLPTGEEQRRRLWSSLSGEVNSVALADSTALLPSEFGAQNGDVLLVWLEANDGDVVSGPNLGSSNTVSLQIASSAQALSMQLPRLRAVLDELLDLLADRLESPVPEQLLPARQRFDELNRRTEDWVEELTTMLAEAQRDAQQVLLDVDQLQGIADRTHRELRREAAAYRDPGGTKRWLAADQRMVEEHEKDTLLLADMFAQALVDEAQVLTQELANLKDEMRRLIEELRKEQSPEAKRALLSEIAKAQQRLRELAQSLSRLSQRVPNEFINREAIPQGSARNSLEDLKAAIESGDLDAAEQHLQELSEQIDQLAQHIDSGGDRFREARFGPQDQALAEARQKLSMLAGEQDRLAQRTRDVVKRATQRAQAESRAAASPKGLSEAAERIERDLRAADTGSMSDFESRLVERARDRVRDAADALKTGDVAEAGRMTSAAERDLEQAAASLGADAARFPGHRGTVENAEATGQALQQLRDLGERIGQATPSLRDYIGSNERSQMKGDVTPQREAADAARKLERELGTGPGETPLSPDGENTLRDVQRSMDRAQRSLDRGDPQEAALAQEEARDRIKQLEERLAQRGQRPDAQSGRRREGPGGNGGSVDGPVRIPGADEFSGPVEMRRRLLDAMREPSPTGYEGAVERYYRELLR